MDESDGAASASGASVDSDMGADSRVYNLTPPRPPDTVETILAKSTQKITDFLLSNVDIEAWSPPPAWKDLPPRSSADLERARALHMPRMDGSSNEFYYPDMLLYALGDMSKLDPDYTDRISDFLAGDEHIYLCNASGTGKTRLLFETLSLRWGFYFTCFYNSTSDPYGSRDLAQAFDDIQNLRFDDRRVDAFLRLSGKGSTIALEANRQTASHIFSRVILVRLLVLEHFSTLVDQLGVSDGVARKKWLLLQLRPEELVYGDIFNRLRSYVRKMTDDHVAERISDLYGNYRSKIEFVAVDEAQVALSLAQQSFAFAKGRRHAPILREFVFAIADRLPGARLLVSGTQLGVDVVLDALKVSRTSSTCLRHFHDLGTFRTEVRIRQYLEHFFGPTVAAEHSTLLHRWLRGRHRFIAVVVMCTLMGGVSHLIKFMDTVLFMLTQYRREGQPVLDFRYINLRTALEDRRLEAFTQGHLLRRAVLAFAYGAKTSLFSEASADLMCLGVALFHGLDAEAEIFEPLIFLTLCRWLRNSERFGAHGILQRCLAGNDVQTLDAQSTFVAVAACFTQAYMPGNTRMRFSGPAPPWARQHLVPVLPRFVDALPSFISSPTLAGGAMVEAASTAEDVFEWFSNARRPFLIPDSNFGASMLCFCTLGDAGNAVLLCFHAPQAMSTRSLRRRPLVPTRPEEFYRKLPSAAQRLRPILRSLPALPIPIASGPGTYSKRRTRPARFSIIQVLCFARQYNDDLHDPPVATLGCSIPQYPNLVEIQFLDVVSAL